MSGTSDPLETYREEAGELLQNLEETLIQLEETPQDQDLVNEAFRSLHTIKGSGNMFDLKHIVDFTHQVETVFARVRDGDISITTDIIRIALLAKDYLNKAIDVTEADQELKDEADAILDALHKAVPDMPATGSSQESSPAGEPEETADSERTYRIILEPAPNTVKNGLNPLLLLQELKDLGTHLVMGYRDCVPPFEEIDPQHLYLNWEILLTTDAGRQAVEDVFMFLSEDSRLEINVIDESTAEDDQIDYKRVGEILVERGDVQRNEIEQALNQKAYIGEVLVKQGYVEKERVETALKEQEYIRKIRENRKQGETAGSIRVKTEKLNRLVNLVGEFVSMHSRLMQLADKKADPEFKSFGEQMEGLVRDIRDLSMEIHMVPVDTLFNSFKRMVRDLSDSLEKKVRFQTSGGDTELDKNMIDRLKDPMLHLIRNSIDHGIEDPQDREEKGKDPNGELNLSAYYSGANVVLKVQDDGGGINLEGVRSKAIKQGLLNETDQPTRRELLDLIFQPGFSTSKTATDVSGRGVGMDVVKRNIENLNGVINIETEEEKGTEITIKMPLTLAIVEGLLCRLAGEYYFVNIAYIDECVSIERKDRDERQKLLPYRGGLIPYLELRDVFSVTGESEEYEQVLVCTTERGQIGLLVDTIVDKYQTVIKNLGKLYEGLKGISGAIMLGDGTLALMVDVEALAKEAIEKRENKLGNTVQN
ncbi:MAG: chemotaxis protein CheA [Spirochaetales bacterium]|nr:chemotaxis protein CheA [Spirochaetales bacterium]